MRRAPLALFAAFALAACATQSVPENPQSLIAERVAIMKRFAGALGASGQVAQGKGNPADAKAKLATARTGVERMASLFPPGTALGDRGVTSSRALSTIFANRADFDAKRQSLAAAFAALDAALAQNAKAEIGKQMTAAKTACVACHTKYRAADE